MSITVTQQHLQDICTRGWGLQQIAYLNTGGFDAPVQLYTDPKDKANFTPHTRVWVGASRGALMCSFRGSERTNLINFRSSGRIDLVPQEGAGPRSRRMGLASGR